ncbi:hypothetical protein J2X20_001185 [Pelomonas saccharophila]|uniref:XapX domain-containing protein n=1 Tax=Roseateles saccharophilus TaxID=304 RepID=A0ABU1YKP3_ROSSA|nr:hypothetical protein [Roseateles saccharophilus]MDR7268556.1 hypothetical protein [Roseateles saccharophilus]
MQASTRRLLSTFFIAVAGAAISLVSAAHGPPPELAAPLACGLLAQVALAPR